MIENKLEIILITYNRAKYLDNTLLQLINSPFSKCKLTIINNSSTDNTLDICSKYQKIYPNLHIITNKLNIGGNANILRAVETSHSKYTWILADNDNFNFENCNDLIDAICSEHYDIILTCSIGVYDPNRKTIAEELKEYNIKHNLSPNNYLATNSNHILDVIEAQYFHTMSFIPATIFKTEKWDSDCLIKGYDNIPNMYPHFPFIVKSLEENFSVYKTKNEIVLGVENPNSSYTSLKWLNSWLESSLLIKDKNLRKRSINKFYATNSFLVMIIGCIITGKSMSTENFKNQIITTLALLKKVKGISKGVLYGIIVILISIIPQSLCKKIFEKIGKKKLNKE